MTDTKPMATIDLLGEFPCEVQEASTGRLQLKISLVNSENPVFSDMLHHELRLHHGSQWHPTGNSAQHKDQYKQLLFDLPQAPAMGETVMLTLRERPLTVLEYTNAGWKEAANASIMKLAPSEIRPLGMQLRQDVAPHIPYSREVRKGFDSQKHAPITDLHTHFSAQISAKDLFEIALDASMNGNDAIAYPVELLELIGAGATRKQKAEGQIIQTKARGFSPLRHEGLACEQEGGMCEAIRLRDLNSNQVERIINQMRVMPDKCISPTKFDREMYRFRNPFAKNPDLTKATIKKEAEAYARMGVEYATLSTSSMLSPEWFKAMEEAVDEIERDGGVMVDGVRKPMHMRFLVGVPRNISPEETFVALNKIKFLARHPYIVGMDMNGYESNKTDHFFWALAHMGRWARDSHAIPDEAPWNFKEKFIIQVHAGETAKNQGNVGRAIALARHYDVRVMVGHALSAVLGDDVKRWLNTLGSEASRLKDAFLFQMCPDSNQAFQAKPLVHRSPLMTRMRQAQCVLSSDGGGALGTNPHALAYSAIAAGASLDHLASIRDYERGFIDRQLEREAKNRTVFEQTYGVAAEGSQHFLDAYKTHGQQFPHATDRNRFQTWLPSEFEDKRPLFIGGAAGSSWGLLHKLDQWEIEQFMDFLVEVVDPKTTYFVLGRVQNDGVSKALDIAVNRHNKKHPENPFSVLGRLAGTPTGELAETITWLQPIADEPNMAATNMIRFLHHKDGKALLFPGQDYTAEMIIEANNEYNAVPNAFMVPRPNMAGDDLGKIFELAETMPAEGQFSSNHAIAPTQIGKENAAIDVFISRILQPRSSFIKNEADRNQLLRDGVDLQAVKQRVLDTWLAKHKTDVKRYIETPRERNPEGRTK